MKLNRLSPFWKPNDGTQVTGLINLINDCKSINNSPGQVWAEIGSQLGESALLFCSFEFIEKLYCIDPLNNIKSKIFWERLNHVKEKVDLIARTSDRAVDIIKNESLDGIFIDASKDYDYAKRTLEIYYPKVKIGGFVSGHDYDSKNKKRNGLMQAVDEFLSSHNYNIKTELSRYVDSSYMFQKK